MLRILLFIVLAFLAYQFIFKFLIPVIRTTRQLKKGFKSMQDRMEELQKQQFDQSANPPPKQKPAEKKGGDYIDFEEIK